MSGDFEKELWHLEAIVSSVSSLYLEFSVTITVSLRLYYTNYSKRFLEDNIVVASSIVYESSEFVSFLGCSTWLQSAVRDLSKSRPRGQEDAVCSRRWQ